ncbi:retinoic acid receptor RXR-beta-like [Panthera pardus]|uniref:Retinoic acid receptor RXR-beta-like n=1 Tax=Panthera pardus TaxID=9691 RepID=A0A9V1F9M8_PANPR|nr:retinoic acid receptor RXR-beta-like [Panthera pardus]
MGTSTHCANTGVPREVDSLVPRAYSCFSMDRISEFPQERLSKPTANAAIAPAHPELSLTRALGELGHTSVEDFGDWGKPHRNRDTREGSPSPGFPPTHPPRSQRPRDRQQASTGPPLSAAAAHFPLGVSKPRFSAPPQPRPLPFPFPSPPSGSLAPISPLPHPPHRALCTCSAACERARHVTPPNVALCYHVTQVRTRRSGV